MKNQFPPYVWTISIGKYWSLKLVIQAECNGLLSQLEIGTGERTCLCWKSCRLMKEVSLTMKWHFWKPSCSSNIILIPHIVPEQRGNHVIICRIHLYMVSVDLLLANYILGKVSPDWVKINKNPDMKLSLKIFHLVQLPDHNSNARKLEWLRVLSLGTHKYYINIPFPFQYTQLIFATFFKTDMGL